jgi:hypothetical protein
LKHCFDYLQHHWFIIKRPILDALAESFAFYE